MNTDTTSHIDTTSTPSRQQVESRDFARPDETRPFPLGRLELISVGGADIGRLVLDPGWRWSEHVKPIAGTDLCEAPHFQYHVAGTLRIRTGDGEEFDAPAGTFVYVADPKSRRGAVATAPGTALLAVGGEPGCAYTPSEWDQDPLP